MYYQLFGVTVQLMKTIGLQNGFFFSKSPNFDVTWSKYISLDLCVEGKIDQLSDQEGISHHILL